MGAYFAKTFMPKGYEEWLTGSKIGESTEEPMDQSIYDLFVDGPEIKDAINQIALYYTNCEQEIITDIINVVASWPRFSEEAGIRKQATQDIAKYHRLKFS